MAGANICWAQANSYSWLHLSSQTYAQDDINLNSKWRAGSDDLYMALRSNAPHFWSWTLKHASKYVSTPMLEGTVIGDLHGGNIGLVKQKDKIDISVIDLDDGGQAPLILDLVQFLVRVKVQNPQQDLTSIYRAYTQGLSGQIPVVPLFLQNALQSSTADFEKIQNKYIEKITNKEQDRFDYIAAELTPIQDAPPHVQKLYKQNRKKFLTHIKSHQVLDAAYTIKQTGGSQNMLRFWFLIKLSNGQLQVIEAKQMGIAATAEYQKQLDHQPRVKSIMQQYWSNPIPEFNVINGKNADFLIRPKLKYNFKEKDLSYQDLEKYNHYIASWLGWTQAQQNKTNTSTNSMNTVVMQNPQLESQVLNLVDVYLKVVTELYKNEN